MKKSVKKELEYNLPALVEEVRKLDKYQGIKLKHPVKILDPMLSYNMNLQNTKIYFLSVAIILNNQKPDDYFVSDGSFIHMTYKVSLDNDYFVENSYLFHMNNFKKYEINSDEFRGRFVTLLCMKLGDIIPDIVDSRFVLSKKKLNEYEEKELILHDVIRIFNRFIISYLEGHDFEKDLFNVFTLLSIQKAYKKKFKKYKMKMLETVHEQKDRLIDGRSGLKFVPSLMEDDIAINNVIKLAYVVTTESLDISKTPYISDGISVKDSREIKELVEALGATINLYDRKKPLLYQIFMKTIPNIEVKWSDVNFNLNLKTGCKALYYLDFICHDRKIHQLIQSMIVS